MSAGGVTPADRRGDDGEDMERGAVGVSVQDMTTETTSSARGTRTRGNRIWVCIGRLQANRRASSRGTSNVGAGEGVPAKARNVRVGQCRRERGCNGRASPA